MTNLNRLPLSNDNNFILTQRDELVEIKNMSEDQLANYVMLIDTSIEEEGQNRSEDTDKYISRLNSLKKNILGNLHDRFRLSIDTQIEELKVIDDHTKIYEPESQKILVIHETFDVQALNRSRGYYLFMIEQMKSIFMIGIGYSSNLLDDYQTLFKAKTAQRHYEQKFIEINHRMQWLMDPKNNPTTNENVTAGGIILNG